MTSHRQIRSERLLDASMSTLAESWAMLARATSNASLVELTGASAAIFVDMPEREYFNNCLRRRDVGEPEAVRDAIRSTYQSAGVDSFAVWVHESDTVMADALRSSGFASHESTMAMGMDLDQLQVLDTSSLDLAVPDVGTFLEINGLDRTMFPRLGGAGCHLYVAHWDGRPAAALMTFDHAGDCTVAFVATLDHARRRGLASMLTTHALTEARARGCRTASLQSTPMAERVYRGVGFVDLGRIHEWAPGT